MNNKKSIAVIGACALMTLATGVNAQDGEDSEKEAIEEIIVTATKRAAAIEDVPFSINAMTEQDIQRLGATNLEDLSRNVASLMMQDLGPGQSQVAIRGVSAGQIVRDQPGVKEQVGVYLDETVISLSLFTPDLDLYDLSRVETLRGPQGTLFGSGSVGGTIRYITRQPDTEGFAGSAELDLNTVTDGGTGGYAKGMINVPLADGQAALRMVGYSTKFAGFIDALGEGGAIEKDVNSGTRTGGRIALKWDVTENLSITPRVVYQKIDMDGFNRQEVFNLFANPYTTTRPAIQLGDRQQYLLLDEGFKDETTIADLTLLATHDKFDTTFVASYTDRDILVSRDASALTGSVSVDLGYPDAGVLLPSNLQDRTGVKQSTFELRFSSNYDSPLQWLAGAFYSDTERDYSQRLPTPGYDAFTDAVLGEGTSAAVANGFGADSPFNSDLPYDLTQLAFFGELNYDISEKLHLTAGGRYYSYDESRDIKTGGLFAAGGPLQTDKTDSSGFIGRVIAAYDLNDNVTFNGQISQGFRLGGVNDPLNINLCTGEDIEIFGGFQSYDDETLMNYEAGVKMRTDNGVSLNAAVFHTKIDDLQVTLDAGSCSSRISFNVPKAHTTGFEFELSANPVDGLQLSFSGSVLEAEFDSTVVDATGSILGGVEDGNRLASVPELQLAALATYYFPFALAGDGAEAYVSGSIQYIGDRITQPSDQVPGAGIFTSGLPFGGATGDEVTTVDLLLDPYQTLNLSTGLIKNDWEVVLYLNNVTDENADLSFDRERGGRARLGFRTNMPRTLGLTYRTRF